MANIFYIPGYEESLAHQQEETRIRTLIAKSKDNPNFLANLPVTDLQKIVSLLESDIKANTRLLAQKQAEIRKIESEISRTNAKIQTIYSDNTVREKVTMKWPIDELFGPLDDEGD